MTGVDTDRHPLLGIYSAGNFGEVAPERLSPFSWSVVGTPMEHATRRMVAEVYGKTAWAQGSHYVFVGYFGCRPYHNLSAYCHLAANTPGTQPRDVTDAYFEGVAPPARVRTLDLPRRLRAGAPLRMLRQLALTTPRLRALEERTLLLEAAVPEDRADGIGLHDVLRQAFDLLREGWSIHILSTSGLVPLRAVERRALRALARHGDELETWLARPSELVWERLHSSSAAADGAGAFLATSFYEVADSVAPWSEFAVRHRVDAPGGPDAVRPQSPLDVGTAALEMLPQGRRQVVRALSAAVGETMAAREHSKSLVMRLLHLFRRGAGLLAAHHGLDHEQWPYLTAPELLGLHRDASPLGLVPMRRAACEEALSVRMPDTLDLRAGSVLPWGGAGAAPARGVSPGRATGTVMHLNDAEGCDELDDVILVCRSADADILPLLPFALGIVSERGSQLSHIAILSREYGIPCVVGYRGAVDLAAGTPLTVDGGTGEVTIHDR